MRPYKDYLSWLRSQDAGAALATWRDYLTELDGPTRLVAPRDARRSPCVRLRTQTFLPVELTGRLQDLARQRGTTLSTVVQGLWAVLLGRLTGRDDVVFGVTVSGRPAELAGIEGMVGLFINTLPLRVRLEPGVPLMAFLAGIQERQTRLLAHQHMGLAEIQRAAGTGEIFDTLVVFENYPVNGAVSSGLDTGPRLAGVEGHDGTHYPLTLMVVPGDRLHLRLDYDPERFELETAEAIAARMLRLLEAAVHSPDVPLFRLEILAAGERRQLLEQFNATKTSVPEATLPELFEAQVEQTPAAVALIFDDEELTYAELDAQANRLAHHLIGLGVGPEALVGICLERSFEMVVAILGILKAGGGYLPLDPDYPEARLASMLADAAPAAVLSTIASRGRLPAAADVLLLDAVATRTALGQAPADNPTDEERVAALLPQHPAYVIYTSGSTGTPKGAPNTHQGLVNRVLWMQAAYGFDATDRVLQKTPYSFDVSVWEFLLPLLSGARLVVVRRACTVTRIISSRSSSASASRCSTLCRPCSAPSWKSLISMRVPVYDE